MSEPNRYTRIMEWIFRFRYTPGATEVPFPRSDIELAGRELGIELPKNLGDVVYSFRYRTMLPASIRSTAPAGCEWSILPDGRSRYKFVARPPQPLRPSPLLAETKILDSTPGLISKYALDDEQALLAKLRYNRLIDIFTGVTCYSLQSHLRTAVTGIGQVETDEIYVGVDRRGAQYIIPIQAKSSTERLGIVQIEQDFALCAQRFPLLICRPIAAQFLATDLIALFELESSTEGIRVVTEKHYRLVPPAELSPEELQTYQVRSE